MKKSMKYSNSDVLICVILYDTFRLCYLQPARQCVIIYLSNCAKTCFIVKNNIKITNIYKEFTAEFSVKVLLD